MILLPGLLQLMRWKNLLIVTLTQFLIYHYLLLPYMGSKNIIPTLSTPEVFLLIFCTLCLTGSGFIINDITDIQSDKINTDKYNCIPDIVPLHKAHQFYFIVLSVGILPAIYLAMSIGEFYLILLYPMAAGSLYFYSTSWQQKALWGNVVVSAFCAGVIGVLLIPDLNTLVARGTAEFWLIILALLFFSFTANLAREIIKDIEDVNGDSAAGLKTLPIIFSVDFARYLAIGLLVVLFLTFFILQLFWDQHNSYLTFILFLLNIWIMCCSAIRLYKAKSAREFNSSSSILKWIMVTGLVHLIIMAKQLLCI